MSTQTTTRTVEKAAVAALQVATLLVNHPADDVAAFINTMTGQPRPDTYARPRHMKHRPTTDTQEG